MRPDCLILTILVSAGTAMAGPVEFNRDVRPILAENCYLCHGPDKNNRKKNLRLDDRASAIERKAIVPGKTDDSELVRRILSDDATERMPPEDTHKQLTKDQKEILKRWVAEGAVYQQHWAYIVPKRPPIPTVRRPQSEIRNPIDSFLLARLEKEGIAPSPPAAKGMLLRRLSLDLTGLPPTPEELHAFLSDNDPRAYEKQIDRLLASPHYGERMAVPWLDLVRFSDTVGYHGDQNQNVFPYRDYVIDSFNRNKRFDVFTREQLAGDLLPDATTESRVATAFNRLNMMTREGGAQPGEYLAKYAADRVRTVSITWLGSTMGCAECHDHKFDPFTQRDFYSLAAYFADIKQWGVYQDYDYTPNPDLKGWSNDHPFPPEIEVTSPYLVQRRLRMLDQIDGIVRDAGKKLAESPTAYHDWLAAARAELREHPDGWAVQPIRAPLSASFENDDSIVLSGPPVKGQELRLPLQPGAGWVAAIRLELLPDESHNGKITRNNSGTASVGTTVVHRRAADGKEAKVGVYFAEADDAEPRYSNGFALLGVQRGWRTPSHQAKKRQTAVYILDQPLQLAAGDQLIVAVKSDNLGRVRLATSPFAPAHEVRPDVDSQLWMALTLTPAEFVQQSDADRELILQRAYLLGTAWDREAFSAVRTKHRDFLACRHGRSQCLVTESAPPRVTRVLPRGNWLDESGAIVEPATPGFLKRSSVAHASGSERKTRLDLANWLVSTDNPLTARVFVNRLWKQFFGVGLSSVMEDVGAQGEWPVHPELLDWLAVEFRESGWDVKHMVRLIVMSAAYQQSSRARPELRERDPTNRLVAFQSPRRLEAEFVRDTALAIAGLLNRDIGGPSVHPYQPANYYSQLQFPDRDYAADKDDRQYRRGVYTHWQRTFPHPMLTNFDAPAREECTANRTVANTPQQALTLLNDPTFVEAARALAQRIMAQAGDAERLEMLYEMALSRKPKPEEIATLSQLLKQQRAHYGAELPAWTDVCRAVLNLQETITRY